MELGFCDLGSKLASESSSNTILFLRDMEDLLTSHPCSSMNSHLDVLVASYQNDDLYCLLQNYFNLKQFSYLGAVTSQYRHTEN